MMDICWLFLALGYMWSSKRTPAMCIAVKQ